MKVILVDSRKNEDNEYPRVEVVFPNLEQIDRKSRLVEEVVLDVRDALLGAEELFPGRNFLPMLPEAYVGNDVLIVVKHDAFDYLKLMFRSMVETPINLHYGVVTAPSTTT